MKKFEYRIYPEIYENMLVGNKKVEVRLLNEKSSQIKVDDEIRFFVVGEENKFLDVEVTNLYYFDTVDDLWENKTFNLMNDNLTKEKYLKLIYEIFGKQEVKTHKLVAIEFKIKKK